jgi:tRNA threonylcarbamoyladenosine modification (KEOPS) complex  Pcc1 subunit
MMNKNNSFSVKSTIEFNFESSRIRDISYNSFLPEFKKLQTMRSEISMKKKNDTIIIFEIKSKDITAYRASINEIISFGKVISNSMGIVKKS